jgi:hypothetical protein
MQRLIAVVGICLLGSLAVGAQAPPKQAGAEPKATWYFYTVKWGLQDEFLDLFQPSQSCIPIARNSRRKNSAASRCSSPTGTCR